MKDRATTMEERKKFSKYIAEGPGYYAKCKDYFYKTLGGSLEKLLAHYFTGMKEASDLLNRAKSAVFYNKEFLMDVAILNTMQIRMYSWNYDAGFRFPYQKEFDDGLMDLVDGSINLEIDQKFDSDVHVFVNHRLNLYDLITLPIHEWAQFEVEHKMLADAVDTLHAAINKINKP